MRIAALAAAQLNTLYRSGVCKSSKRRMTAEGRNVVARRRLHVADGKLCHRPWPFGTRRERSAHLFWARLLWASSTGDRRGSKGRNRIRGVNARGRDVPGTEGLDERAETRGRCELSRLDARCLRLLPP